MIKTAHSAKLVLGAQFFSYFGLSISIFTLLAFLIGDFQVFRQFIGQYQPSLPIGLIYLMIGFITGVFAYSKGLWFFIFLLPLTPNLHFQLEQYSGFSYSYFVQSNQGLDLVVGFVCGVLMNTYPRGRVFLKGLPRKNFEQIVNMPWQIGLALGYILLSSCLAVLRNIRQSASHTSIDGILFNVLNFRSLSWHDDFFPLADLFAYGLAALMIAVLLPILSRSKKPVYDIFHPLTLGIIASAILGITQSLTGIGLSDELLGFRNDRLGYVAIGFQPDLHSYASHMLLGVLGLWGYYLKESNALEKKYVLIAIILSWCALLLSKSRASLFLAILATTIGLAVYVYYSRRMSIKKILTILGLIGICCFAFFYYLLSQHELVLGLGWLELLISKFSRLGIAGLSDATQNFGGRPEIYLAGLRMWSEFPLIGLGQGEFFRQSADVNFSHSFMLSQWGGENAHNYFLQILVENGLIGFFIICYAVLFPVKFIFDTQLRRSALAVGLIGLAALLFGNVFAHSLLVRENLILAAILIAIMYSWYYSINLNIAMAGGLIHRVFASPFAIIFVVIVIFFSLFEIYHSFYRFPFQTGSRCFVTKPLSADGWTSGIYEYPIPAGSKGVRIELDTSKIHDIVTHPVKVRADIVYFNKDWSYDNNSLVTKNAVWNTQKFESLDLKIADNRLLENNRGKLVLRLSGCYVPKNLGQSFDGRSLGVQLINVGVY